MNAITNVFDSVAGQISDPIGFLALDASTKKQVIAIWADHNAKIAKTFDEKADAFFSDAQLGYSFLTPQLHRIEAEVYMTKYPSFDINRFMTVDSSGDMWDVGTLVYSMDKAGEARFMAGGAFDMPYASTNMTQNTKNYHLAAIGYEWNTQELQRAAKLGRALSSDKAGAAVLASEKFIYDTAMTGKTEKGWTGFTNDAVAPSAQVANDGTGPSRLWSAKSVDLILRDINEALTAVETGTGETHIANTLVLPTTAYNTIASTRVGDTNVTILHFLQANNVAGESLTILKSRALETVGPGGTRRLIAYDNNPQVVKFHLPGPHQFLPAFQKSSLVYEVGGIMNVGGVEVRLPKAIVYRDSF